jgi:hypothetical protein
MQPLDDKELDQLLRTWEAPHAPASLQQRVFPQNRSRWTWLLNGSVRIPVPVGVALVLIIGLWIYYWRPAPGPAVAKPQEPVSLVDFQPVRQLEPIVVVGGQK